MANDQNAPEVAEAGVVPVSTADQDTTPAAPEVVTVTAPEVVAVTAPEAVTPAAPEAAPKAPKKGKNKSAEVTEDDPRGTLQKFGSHSFYVKG